MLWPRKVEGRRCKVDGVLGGSCRSAASREQHTPTKLRGPEDNVAGVAAHIGISLGEENGRGERRRRGEERGMSERGERGEGERGRER